MGLDFLQFDDLPASVVHALLARAQELAQAWQDRQMPASLANKRVAVIVDDGGWRNTAAFGLGVQAMGALCERPPISFGPGKEAIEDLAGYLDNWFDALVVRTPSLKTLKALAKHSAAPVINARTHSNHPCEILGDLAYVLKQRGTIDGLTVACVAPDANILRSWVEASRSLPIRVLQVYPRDWHVTDAQLLNPRFATSTDLADVCDADVLITDCWLPNAPAAQILPFQVTSALLARCRPDLIFLPCPPVWRGQELSADAMLHESCQSKAAKAFLLHAQNALLEWTFREH